MNTVSLTYKKVPLAEKKSAENIKFFMTQFHVVPLSFVRVAYDKNGINDTKAVLARSGVLIKYQDNFVGVDSFVYKLAFDTFNVNNINWNQTFHKSWDKVANAPIEQLIFEQVLHYFSTYGMENLGYQANAWVPTEDIFDGFETKPNFKAFTVLEIVEDEVAINLFMDYLRKLKAPHRQLVNQITDLMMVTDATIDDIASFELKIARCQQTDLVPTDGQDWLRYVIYRTTGKTLLIKNKKTINSLKYAPEHSCNYAEFLSRANLKNLATVFYRFKPLFLAMRSQRNARPYINKIRRLADTYHQPMSIHTVQNIANLMNNGNWTEIRAILNSCSARQLVKLYNFANAEKSRGDIPVLYTIRNGRVFVNGENGDFCREAIEILNRIENLGLLRTLVLNNLNEKFKDVFKGKKFLIPSYLNYACPISEKQFSNNIPYGSSIHVPDDNNFVVAVHWKNWKNRRTDLDLHMNSETEHYGWNGSWRDGESAILFSGDMTDAPGEGATEAYSFNPNVLKDKHFVLTINNYCGEDGVNYQFLMTTSGFKATGPENCFDPYLNCVKVDEAIFPPIPLQFTEDSGVRAMTIGLINGDKFFFYGGDLGEHIVPNNQFYASFLQALTHKMKNQFDLYSLIVLGGGEIFTENSLKDLTDEERSAIMNDVIDLSPDVVTAQQLMDLVDTPDNNK